MKIMWNSVAPWIPTGYGQQTGLFTPRIRDLGHDVAISAFVGLEGTIGSWEDMPVYPSDLTKLNKYMLRKYVQHFAGKDGSVDDVQVITLQDVWTWLEPKYGGIADYRGLKIASWVPIDHDPAPPPVLQALEEFGVRPIAMSRFGERELKARGFDPLYAPHGIDTTKMCPAEDRDMVRHYMKIPQDRFVVGMVANNQGQQPPRKAFPQVFETFAVFQQRHPDAFLYLHTDMRGLNQGLNLFAMAQVFGIPPDSIAFVNQDRYWMFEIGQEQLGRVYSAMDVLVNPSYGEGFGIPIVEAQACGTPVIATDWTAMTELVGAGWLVDGDPYYDPSCGSRWKNPSLGDLLEKLEMAYEARNDTGLRERAREFALQYDVDRVVQDYWVPVLDQLGRPREVPALPNRQMKRAARKAGKAAA